MTDLDAEIAEKVMGWAIGHGDEFAEDPNHEWRGVFDPEQQAETGYGLSRTKSPYSWESWTPSESIEQAWQVVEKMRGGGAEVYIETKNEKWWACFALTPIDTGSWFAAEADTLPEAICRAALEVTGSDSG